MARLLQWLAVGAAVIAAATGAGKSVALAQEPWSRDHTGAQKLRGFHSLTGVSAIKRSFRADNEARVELEKILSAIGLAYIADRITLRASAETANAEASIAVRPGGGGEERLIFYNSTFMQTLKLQTGQQWSLIAILAHELGHHLAFHTVIPGRNHEFELEADYFSGFVLRRLGASLEQAHGAMRVISPKEASATHPGLDQRLQAISIGWTDGGSAGSPRGLKAGASASATTPPAPATQPASPPPSWTQPPTVPPAAAGIPTSSLTAFCAYNNGPKLNLIERFNMATNMVAGLPCHDGRGSTGVAIGQPTSQVWSARGLNPAVWSHTCRYHSGPKAGRNESYPHLAAASIGTFCNDSLGSLGFVVRER